MRTHATIEPHIEEAHSVYSLDVQVVGIIQSEKARKVPCNQLAVCLVCPEPHFPICWKHTLAVLLPYALPRWNGAPFPALVQYMRYCKGRLVLTWSRMLPHVPFMRGAIQLCRILQVEKLGLSTVMRLPLRSQRVWSFSAAPSPGTNLRVWVRRLPPAHCSVGRDISSC